MSSMRSAVIAGIILVACTPFLAVTSAPIRLPLAPLDVDEDVLPPLDKDHRVNVNNIAKSIRKGNLSAARKLAADAAKQFEDFYELENLYRQRNKGGLGWSTRPGPVALQDGLERQMLIMMRGAPANVLLDQEHNLEAAYAFLAMAELTIVMAPKKNMGRKTIALWNSQSQALRDSANELRQAFAVNDARGVKQAATKMNDACARCHDVFRD